MESKNKFIIDRDDSGLEVLVGKHKTVNVFTSFCSENGGGANENHHNGFYKDVEIERRTDGDCDVLFISEGYSDPDAYWIDKRYLATIDCNCERAYLVNDGEIRYVFSKVVGSVRFVQKVVASI